MSQSSHLPWEPIEVIFGGEGGHYLLQPILRALYSIANHFPLCLFPSITYDNHIIGPPSILSFAHEHFQIELCETDLSIQLQKCVTWLLSSLPQDFNTPSQFTTPLKGIRVLGVPLGTSTFTSSFIKNAMLKYVKHVDFPPKIGDVHITFGSLIRFMQCPSYLLQYTPPSSTFTKSFFFQLFPLSSVLTPFGSKIF